ARALGADIGLNYKTNPDWSKKVYQLTNRRGVDIVIEHVGAATWDHSIRVLRRGGRLVTCGATTGGEVSLHLQRLFFKNLEILGSTMGTKAELHRIVHLMASGDLKPMVDQVLPLADIQEAHRILEAREAFGKVVITP
ncbi:MAG: zinc-binding dehydrogenase, partial [Myxococcota bacterium]|nr:zinc-binding dehydrogenase [Myxococcota bacterium]